MTLKERSADPRKEAAMLDAAVSARAAGLSWRQIEAQLQAAGIKVSHVTLRAKLTKLSEEKAAPVITRASVIKELRPLINANRAAGKSMREIADELTAAGLIISTSSLRVFVSKTNAAERTLAQKIGSSK